MSRAAAHVIGEMVRGARALVFDFDGTLVDSNGIKWRAFEACFADVGERRGEVLAYCRGHHHVPRGEKFRHVYENILGRPYTADVAAALDARFAGATTGQIVTAAEIPGAGRFVHAVARHHLTALLSSTPHEVLLSIVAARGWRESFTTVRGAPVDKAAWLGEFAEAHRLAPSAVLFFGDTAEDARAAERAGCGFVAVANEELAGGGAPFLGDFAALAEGGS